MRVPYLSPLERPSASKDAALNEFILGAARRGERRYAQISFERGRNPRAISVPGHPARCRCNPTPAAPGLAVTRPSARWPRNGPDLARCTPARSRRTRGESGYMAPRHAARLADAGPEGWRGTCVTSTVDRPHLAGRFDPVPRGARRCTRSWLEPTVQLRLGEIRAGLAQGLVGCRTSRCSCLIRSRSAVVTPGLSPWSRSCWRTHSRCVSASQPNFAAIGRCCGSSRFTLASLRGHHPHRALITPGRYRVRCALIARPLKEWNLRESRGGSSRATHHIHRTNHRGLCPSAPPTSENVDAPPA